jgi:long-chain acyl-CoA synthetase
MSRADPSNLPGGFTPMTLGRFVRTATARGSQRPAILCDGRRLNYGELVARMNQIGHIARHEWRLGPGDRVALLAPNCLEYVEIVVGLSEIGIIVTTLNSRLSRAELAAIIDDCAPAVLLVHPACEALAEGLAQEALRVVRVDSGYEALLTRARDTQPVADIPEWAAFSLSYTSGTTGKPKGVLLPHRSRALTFLAMGVEYGCFGPDDHFLNVTPLYHGAGFAFACGALAFGGAVTIIDKLDSEDYLRRLSSGDFTATFLVPTILHRLFGAPDAVLRESRMKNVKAIISNAAALPQASKERFVELWGDRLLHETYGSTEAGIVTNIRPADQLRKQNSCGTPFPLIEIELRDEDGRTVQTGKVGELFCRGPYTFNGYLNRPQETAETLRDGWVTVGDMAYRDDEGFYHIVDRKKDMVISGGINIYPREVENVIAGIAGVREVAVVGLPDAEWGEALHAFVVPATDSGLTGDAVTTACRAQLSGYKVPRGVSFVDDLPKNGAGKILKNALRDTARAKIRA